MCPTEGTLLTYPICFCREAWRAGLALATMAIVLGVASTFSGESAGALQEAAGQSPSQVGCRPNLSKQ